MSAVAVEISETLDNPVDLIEELVTASEWPYDRMSEDELVVEIGGRWCSYRLYFGWHRELEAIQLSCEFDLKVQKGRRAAIYELLAEINARLWIGHFEICPDARVPVFRHTLLLRGTTGLNIGQMEDMIEVSLEECDRFYPAFQFVVWGGKTPAEAVAAAVLDTVGEA